MTIILPPADGGASDTLVTDAIIQATADQVSFLQITGAHRFDADPFDAWRGDILGVGYALMEFTTTPGLIVAKNRQVANLAVTAQGTAVTLLDNARASECLATGAGTTDGFVFAGNHQQLRGCRTNGCNGVRWANGRTYGNQRIDTLVTENAPTWCWKVDGHAMIDACQITNVHFMRSPVGIWLDPWDRARHGNRGAMSKTTFAGAYFEDIGNAYVYDAGSWDGDWGRQATGREANSVTWIDQDGAPLNPQFAREDLPSDFAVRVAHADDWTIMGGAQSFACGGDLGVFRVLHDPGDWRWERLEQATETVQAAGRVMFTTGPDVSPVPTSDDDETDDVG